MSFLKLQSINLEAAFELAKSLSEERYDFVKKLAPMGKYVKTAIIITKVNETVGPCARSHFVLRD